MMLRMQATQGRCSLFFARGLFALLLAALCSLSAHSQAPETHKPTTRLARAIDRTLEQGHDAILPPHVSNLLGISPQEQEVPVKQFAVMGEPIRGFEISTAEQRDIVLFVESREKKESTFYLTSPSGTLRRVLQVTEGVGHPRRPLPADKEAFEKEKQYWLDQLAPKKS
jgi:hypothetical protein